MSEPDPGLGRSHIDESMNGRSRVTRSGSRSLNERGIDVFIGCYGDNCSEKCSVIDAFRISPDDIFYDGLEITHKCLLTFILSNGVLCDR